MSTSWNRWRLAIPLIGLSALFFAASLTGTVVWWSLSSPGDRAVRVATSVLSAVSLAASVSIGTMRAEDVPWVRIGVVAGGLVLCCGLAAVF